MVMENFIWSFSTQPKSVFFKRADPFLPLDITGFHSRILRNGLQRRHISITSSCRLGSILWRRELGFAESKSRTDCTLLMAPVSSFEAQTVMSTTQFMADLCRMNS